MSRGGFTSSAIMTAGEAGGGDPNWANVVLLVGNDNKADTTFAFDDQSNSNHTVSRTGDAQYDTAQAPTGMTSSVLFDGTGDTLTIPDHADLEFGSGDFTIEFWFRVAATTLFGLITKGGLTECWRIMAEGAAFGLRFYASSNGTSFDIADFSPMGLYSVDTWTHVAVAREGSTWRKFVNGVKNGTDISSAAALADVAVGMTIGDGGGNDFLNGWMAAVRLTKGVARYTANFTPPDLPFPAS